MICGAQVGKYGDINIKCPIKKEFRKYRRTDFLSDLGGYKDKTEKLRNLFPLFPILLIILSGLRTFFFNPTLSISPSSTNSQGNSVCDESTGKAQSYDKKNEDQFSSSLCFVLTLFYLRLWKQSELTLHTSLSVWITATSLHRVRDQADTNKLSKNFCHQTENVTSDKFN